MKTDITVEVDSKGIKWIRAGPVNLVVSIYGKEIRVWTCKKFDEEGQTVFILKAKKDGEKWKIEYDLGDFETLK